VWYKGGCVFPESCFLARETHLQELRVQSRLLRLQHPRQVCDWLQHRLQRSFSGHEPLVRDQWRRHCGLCQGTAQHCSGVGSANHQWWPQTQLISDCSNSTSRTYPQCFLLLLERTRIYPTNNFHEWLSGSGCLCFFLKSTQMTPWRIPCPSSVPAVPGYDLIRQTHLPHTDAEYYTWEH